MKSIMRAGKPFSPKKTEEIVNQFFQDGYYFIGSVLEEDEVCALKGAIERKFADKKLHNDEDGDYIRGTGFVSLMRMFEYDLNFRDLIVREPLVSLAETILGQDCHMMSQNASRSEPNHHTGWHLDDRVHFPVPDGFSRHDPRYRIPCFVLNMLIPLTDVDSFEDGPTQVVPGSHYAGSPPNSQENPEFEGQGPHTIFAKAGDVYIFHSQIWHRGSPNTVNRPRIMGGVACSQRIISQRLYPFLNYRMPDHVLEGANERLLRLLGKHLKGAYG